MKRNHEIENDAREDRVRRKYDRPSVTTLTSAEVIEALGPAYAGYGNPTGGFEPGF
jgi:hypothetical protein